MKNKIKQSKTSNFPVGDFLTRLKNSALAGQKSFQVKNTKLIKSVALKLKSERYLTEVKEEKGELFITISIVSKKPVLINVKSVSKPGLRIYMDVDEIEKKRGPSIFIISTSKGIKTDKEAIKESLGGEVIAEIW